METNSERIARLYADVQAKIGINTGLPSAEIPAYEAADLGPTLAWSPTLGLGYTKSFMGIGLTDEQIAAGIAHEIGHYKQRIKGPGAELDADLFAAKHGYGRGLVSALQALALYVRQQNLGVDPRLHGTIEQRIARVEAAIPRDPQPEQLSLDLAA
jgi:hypothetical protein